MSILGDFRYWKHLKNLEKVLAKAPPGGFCKYPKLDADDVATWASSFKEVCRCDPTLALAKAIEIYVNADFTPEGKALSAQGVRDYSRLIHTLANTDLVGAMNVPAGSYPALMVAKAEAFYEHFDKIFELNADQGHVLANAFMASSIASADQKESIRSLYKKNLRDLAEKAVADKDIKGFPRIMEDFKNLRKDTASVLDDFLDDFFKIDLVTATKIARGILIDSDSPEQREHAATKIVENMSAYTEAFREENARSYPLYAETNSIGILEDVLFRAPYSNPRIEQDGIMAWRQNNLAMATKFDGGWLTNAIDHIRSEIGWRIPEKGPKSLRIHDEALTMYKRLLVDHLAKTDMKKAYDIANYACGEDDGKKSLSKTVFELHAEAIRDELGTRLKTPMPDPEIVELRERHDAELLKIKKEYGFSVPSGTSTGKATGWHSNPAP